MQFFNLVPIDDMALVLAPVKLAGMAGWPAVVAGIIEVWRPKDRSDVLRMLPGLVGGISPLRPIMNVGTGFAELVMLPIEHYQRDGRVMYGLQRGATSLLRRAAFEAANVSAHLSVGAQVVLEQADDLLTPAHLSNRDGPSVSKFAAQPGSVSEGVREAYRSFTRGLTDAAATIFAVPLREYHQTGTGGMVKSVIRAVPVAILRTGMGTTEALSKTLLGVTNSLDPFRFRKLAIKYKVPPRQ